MDEESVKTIIETDNNSFKWFLYHGMQQQRLFYE